MAIPFFNNVDLNGNQLINGRFEIVAADPTEGNYTGRPIYNSAQHKFKVYLANQWVAFEPEFAKGSAFNKNFGTGAGTVAQGNDSRFPAAGEKEALAGTHGTPSNTNRYVTNSDPRNANDRTPTSHGNDKHTADYITAAEAPVQPGDLHNHTNKTTLDAITSAGSGAVITEAERTLLNGAASAKTNNAIVRRDASGRARVADPAHNDDIANKGYVDSRVLAPATHAATHQPGGDDAIQDLTDATHDPSANTLIRRDENGDLRVNHFDLEIAMKVIVGEELTTQEQEYIYDKYQAPTSAYSFIEVVKELGNSFVGDLQALQQLLEDQITSLVQGMDYKDSVRAATLNNITLSGTQTIDGVALQAGDRVLVKDQINAAQNGIYVVASGAWQRAADATQDNVTPGMYCFVEEGTENENTGWLLSTTGTITVGTTALTFIKFSSQGTLLAGTGLSKSGNTISHTAHTGDVTGATVLTIVNKAVTLAKIQDLTAGRILGRINSNGTAQQLTPAEVRTLLNVADGATALTLGETDTTAHRGDRGKAAYDHTLLETGNPHAVTKADVGLGSVGNYGIANQQEAEAGTAANRYMTPQRTAQAIAALTPALPANLARKAAFTIGGGSTGVYTCDHNFGTYDVEVQVFLNSGDRDTILVNVERTTVNRVTVRFSDAQPANAFRVVITG